MKWAGLLSLAPMILCAQAPPAFEVASVKPDVLPPGSFHFSSSTGAAPAIRISGNRISINISFPLLVAAAYNVKGLQVTGAPRWRDERGGEQFYRVDARTAGEDTPAMDHVRQCLQTLLAERFQLKIHREATELPVYDLVAAKNGPKLKETAGDGEPRASGGPGGVMRFHFANRSIADLVNLLSGNVDRPVFDKTNLAGRYDFDLEFVRGNSDAGSDSADDRSLFTAVQQQLGLKLVPAKGPVDLIVIDHAERPTAN